MAALGITETAIAVLLMPVVAVALVLSGRVETQIQ
jgi:hypothetical protein